jgi:hypothetical protein
MSKRKMLLVGVLAMVSTSWARGQATVLFDNNVPGSVVTHVYFNYDSQNSGRWFTRGNGPKDYPPGTQDYSGMMPLTGPGWSAQLYGAPGPDADRSSLQPALPATTFSTFPGEVIPVIATFKNIPADSAVATLVLRVWDNMAGTLNSWEASQAFGGNSYQSSYFNLATLGGAVNPPAILIGLQSFAVDQGLIPEPSTLSLVSLGAVALLLRRCAQRELRS